MATVSPKRATIDDLLRTEGKAELIGGRIVQLRPTGRKPNRVAGRIFRSLDDYAESTGQGEAYTESMGFAVPKLSSGRESFSPDVSYYVGPFLNDAMKFIKSPPTLAVEVRSENDYGPAAERALAEKRVDYFEAGTRVVWDIDTKAERVLVYPASNPGRPTTFVSGEIAEAESAAPGWRIGIDEIFKKL